MTTRTRKTGQAPVQRSPQKSQVGTNPPGPAQTTEPHRARQVYDAAAYMGPRRSSPTDKPTKSAQAIADREAARRKAKK